MSAAGAVARGPLSTTFSQWSVLGLGALGLYGNDDFCSSMLRGIQKLLVGGGGYQYLRSLTDQQQQQPFIIQQGGMSHSRGSSSMAGSAYYVWLLMQLGMGTMICWGSYVAFANLLPDAVKSVLPVTKKVFDTAVQSLGKAVVNVRDTLTEQILGVERKQDELAHKLDDTHDEVIHVKAGVDELGEMVYRCEQSLSQSERRQLYTAKGIRLVLRCVSSILPSSSKFNTELDQYYRQGNDLGLSNDSGSDNITTSTAGHSTLDSSFESATNVSHVQSTPVCAIPLAQVSPFPRVEIDSSASVSATPQKSAQKSAATPRLDDFQNMVQMMRSIGIQG